jgi:hypothetical protein
MFAVQGFQFPFQGFEKRFGARAPLIIKNLIMTLNGIMMTG